MNSVSIDGRESKGERASGRYDEAREAVRRESITESETEETQRE